MDYVLKFEIKKKHITCQHGCGFHLAQMYFHLVKLNLSPTSHNPIIINKSKYNLCIPNKGISLIY